MTLVNRQTLPHCQNLAPSNKLCMATKQMDSEKQPHLSTTLLWRLAPSKSWTCLRTRKPQDLDGYSGSNTIQMVLLSASRQELSQSDTLSVQDSTTMKALHLPSVLPHSASLWPWPQLKTLNFILWTSHLPSRMGICTRRST